MRAYRWFCLLWAFGLPAAAVATPILQSISPVAVTYTYDTDFKWVTGTGSGDVTANVYAVDYDPPEVMGSSTSGCEAADFAGFAVGSIALIQRGTCNFSVKVLNATAAGASAVLLYNEGDAGRTDAIGVTLGGMVASIPVLFTSYAIGNTLRNNFIDGPTGYVVRMSVNALDDPALVPEPGSLALLTLGLAGLVGVRRRRLPSCA